jgi:hypothetical protein
VERTVVTHFDFPGVMVLRFWHDCGMAKKRKAPKKPKRRQKREDPNQLAYRIVKESTKN